MRSEADTNFEAVAKRFSILRGTVVDQVLEKTAAVLACRPEFAAEAGVRQQALRGDVGPPVHLRLKRAERQNYRGTQ